MVMDTSALTAVGQRLAAIGDAVTINFKGLAERIDAGLVAWRELLTVMAPHGWLIPWDYTMRETSLMFDLYHERGLEAVEAQLIGDFRQVTAVGAVAGLGRRRAVDDWLPVLVMAAAAHDRGEWPLAIPIWLMATEGVMRRCKLAIDDPFSVQSPSGRKARKAVQQLAPRGQIAPPAAEALLTVFAGLSKSATDPAVFSRHTVLHGLRPIVGSEQDSIQCFLALDVLLCLADRG